MHKELFKFSLPEFIRNMIGISSVTIYSYAFIITLGVLIAVIYTKRTAKKDLVALHLSNNFFYSIFIVGFVGGKLFYYLQDPFMYIKNPHLMLNNFSGGFVFYGSFVCIIPFIIWYLKKKRIAVLPMLDIFAITTTIVHAIGRLGCFAAGCCYGIPTNSVFGVVFPDNLNTHVHPTQLYESSLLLAIMLLLLFVKKRKQFQGQLFFLYLIFYALCRVIIEQYRGDERGFVILNTLSMSQFIGICISAISIFFYYKYYKEVTLKIKINI